MDEWGRMTKGEQDEEAVAQLVKLGGPRPSPPNERLDRLRAVAHAEWAHIVMMRRRRRARAIGAVAGLAAVLLLAIQLVRDRDPRSDVSSAVTATLTAATGQVERTRRGRIEPPPVLRIGDNVTGSDEVNTPGAVVAAFRLASGTSLRVNERTRLRIESATLVIVEAGAIYLDTSGALSAMTIEVRTPVGVVRDLGTQFEVDVSELRTRVRVRDGEVVLTHAKSVTRATRGTEIVATADAVTTRAAPVFGAEWGWVGRLPSPFDLSAHTLIDFLQWVSHETGYTFSFESEGLAQRARRMTVQGSIDGLTAEEALDAVLPATGLEYRVRDGHVTIRTPSR